MSETRKKVTAIFILHKQRSNNNQLREIKGAASGEEKMEARGVTAIFQANLMKPSDSKTYV